VCYEARIGPAGRGIEGRRSRAARRSSPKVAGAEALPKRRAWWVRGRVVRWGGQRRCSWGSHQSRRSARRARTRPMSPRPTGWPRYAHALRTGRQACRRARCRCPARTGRRGKGGKHPLRTERCADRPSTPPAWRGQGCVGDGWAGRSESLIRLPPDQCTHQRIGPVLAGPEGLPVWGTGCVRVCERCLSRIAGGACVQTGRPSPTGQCWLVGSPVRVWVSWPPRFPGWPSLPRAPLSRSRPPGLRRLAGVACDRLRRAGSRAAEAR